MTKNLVSFVVSVVLCFCVSPVLAAQEPLKRVRIDTPDARVVAQQLIDAGFDVVEGAIAKDSLEVMVNAADLAELRGRGLGPTVIAVGRPFREIQAERAALAAVAPPGYPDLTEIIAEMAAAAADYPAICRMVDLTSHYGVPATFEGRQIHAVKISDNPDLDEDEPAFLLVSAHHGKEIGTPVVALHAIEQFTSQYGIDPVITDLVNEYEIWIAPVWNPDGYVYAFDFDNGWRKNRHVFGPGPDDVGVELNRNYPFGWSSACSGPTSPSSGSYKGPSPASESETQTMLTMSADRRFAKVLDFHSSGAEVLRGYHCLNHPFPAFLVSQASALSTAFGFSGATRPPSAEGEHYEWQLAMMGAQANLVELRNTPLVAYEVAQQEAVDLFPGILYSLQRPIPLSGHATDAVTGDPVVATLRYLEIDFENGETNSSSARFGRYQVFLPSGEVTIEFSAPGYAAQYHTVTIDTQVARTLDVQLELAALNLELVEGPSGLIETGEMPQIVVQITPGTENLVPGSAMLHYRYDDGPFLGTPLTPAGGDLHAANLPLLDLCGDGHEYYVAALGDGGTQVTLPSNAPGFVFDFDVGESQVVVAFDDAWRYFKGLQEPSPAGLLDWTEVGFEDSGWEEGAGGFGYGADCDPYGTVLDDMQGGYRSLYVRRLFHVDAPGNIIELTLMADYDDAFVAYVNGVEVARNNVLGDPPLFDAVAASDHECSGSPLAANPPEEFRIHDSVDLSTLLLPGDNVLAVQGHNLSDTSSDFTLEMALASATCGCHGDADCDDGDLCNGSETCVADVCVPGTPVDCTAGQVCNPATGICEDIGAEPLPIVEGADWRYFKGTQEPSPANLTDWTAIAFDDGAWQSGNSGFGYGVDCASGTTLDDMQSSYSSLYLRRLFVIENPALVEELILVMDYDDSFVAYINGVEVARNNVLGTPPAYSALAQVDHECSGSAGAANPPESFALHLGFDLDTLLRSGANVLAVHGHNLTAGSSDFTLIPTLSAVETGAPRLTVSFQQGSGGYAGVVDTFIQEEPAAAGNDNGSLETLNWDADDPVGSGFAAMTLIRFEGLFGDGADQVPSDAVIHWATLDYTIGGDAEAAGDDGELHEVLVSWPESVSWNGLGSSPGALEGEDYAAASVAVVTGDPAGIHGVDVTASLQRWIADPAANHGWIVLPTGTNGVDLRSSEFLASPLLRPELTVNFTPVAECDGAEDCDDGAFCNGMESCQSGNCIAGTVQDCDDSDPCTIDSCDEALDECAHVAPSVPAEIENLRSNKQSPGSTVAVLSWDGSPMATSFNVYRGTRSDLGDLTCFLSGLQGVTAEDDGAEPPPGALMVYLATAANCSGESPLGNGRLDPDPCP